MAEARTRRTNASVAAFLAAIPDPRRRRDDKALAALIRETTGERPAMWVGSSIVGYGRMTRQGSRGSGRLVSGRLLPPEGRRSAADASISLASQRSTPGSWRGSSD